MTECSCGAVLNPDNTGGVCAECDWWQRNAELGGEPVPIGEVVDLRHGLANAIALLRAGVVEDQPVITFSKAASGCHRVEFDYHARAVSLLKEAVPAAMRSWIKDDKCWEISAEWTGPLMSKLRNAGFEATGLGQADIADWFGCFSTATPTTEEGHRAYLKGLCKTCAARPHRAGGTECEDCFSHRLTGQYRVKSTLAVAGLAPYPMAQPATAGGRSTRAPLEIGHGDIEDSITKQDFAAEIDVAILARRDQSVAKPTCPICGRRPSKGAVVHVGCRTRLLHALSDRPFIKSRNKAFQSGLCTVCMTRPHRPPGHSKCVHCAEIIDAVNRSEENRG